MIPGRIVGLANDTTLTSKNGKEYQIADSAFKTGTDSMVKVDEKARKPDS
ncbi:MAG: hypothetical protein ABR596_05700 [Halarsenatibacteraceae bacterium]